MAAKAAHAAALVDDELVDVRRARRRVEPRIALGEEILALDVD
ncbi:MAG: hypothetical protein ACR2MO_08825 [Acidimicrobiales bacterium]